MSPLKIFKDYNYYDDEVVYSRLYLFLKKIAGLVLRFLKLILRFIKSIARSIYAKIKHIENEKSASDKDSFNDFVQSVKAFFKNFSVNEFALKMSALALFFVFIISFIGGYAVKIHSFSANESRFSKDAGAVCTKLMSKYGVSKTERIIGEDGEATNLYRITGLAYARQMDFNNDNSPELLVCYEDGGIYYVEIWGYERKDFVKLYAEPANADKENIAAGSFITINHKNSKYSVGRLTENEDGNMELFSLSGKRFKSSGFYQYDIENDIYAYKSKINSTDFETIKLSYITPVRAERIVEATSKHLDRFETKSVKEIEEAKTDDEKRADAYYDIVEKYNQKYGKASVKADEKMSYADGLAVVRLLDFNNDGNKELMLVYRYNKKVSSEDKKGEMVLLEVPAYYMEIYTWNGKSAKLVYENDGLSTFKGGKDNEVFFILYQDGKEVGVCSNTYDYGKSSRVWKGASRVSKMNKDGVFETVFTAVANCDYDYMTYFINDERVYKKEFKEKGYFVPYFCNEDSFDNSKFSVTTLQSSGQKIPQSVVNDTASQIKILNDHYTA